MILLLLSGLSGLIARGATAVLAVPGRPHAVVTVPTRPSAAVTP